MKTLSRNRLITIAPIATLLVFSIAATQVVAMEATTTTTATANTTRATAETHISVTSQGKTVVFSDVPKNTWFASYVGALAKAKIISGYKDSRGNLTGKYGPADDVTVEQVTKIAVESSNTDETNCEKPSKNASAWSRWSELYVACAEVNNWSVFSKGNVKVTRPATRAEVAAAIVSAFNIQTKNPSGSVFTDVSATSSHAAAIETLAASEIIEGYADANGNATGEFGPNDNVNRAEVAKMFSLTMNTYTRN